uniref:Ig-like domain-containing protein n=1 Tax=Lates calcarifer TaxID=8187 RepID=A0A4W6C8S6_LATCA
MDNVSLMASFSLLFSGLTSGNSIYPVGSEVRGGEGQSVTLRCDYKTSASGFNLYWYRHHSDLQSPQFILWKGAGSWTSEHIPDKRYESQTTGTSIYLTINRLTLADTGLYYCALETHNTDSACDLPSTKSLFEFTDTLTTLVELGVSSKKEKPAELQRFMFLGLKL